MLFGKGTRAPMSLGIFGGYPGCNVGYTTFRQANVDELPDRLDELRGAEQFDQFWGTLELHEGDVQYVRFMGGGGYGDPLDRDPELVLAATSLAGLVTDGAAARDLRRRDRRGRGGRGGDAGAAARAARRAARPSLRRRRRARRVARTGMRLSEYLQRTAAARRSAPGAATEVAPAGADWKDHAVLRRLPVEKPGPTAPPSGEFFLIEACCPGCGTLLDTELAAGDDPPLHDRVRRWPG